MRKNLHVILGLSSILLIAAFSGCSLNVGDLEGEDEATARVTLLLRARSPSCPASDDGGSCPGQDDGDPDDGDDGDGGGMEEPGTIRAAVVTISGIYLQGGHAANNADADENGRVWLSNETRTTNLLTLSEDLDELVSEATVERGSYEQLRMIITGGYIEVVQEDGSTAIFASSPDYEGLPSGAEVDGELRMPSFDTSGLKINLPEGAFDIEGEQKIVLLDFDISESFGHEAGNSGAWVMHPVVDATDIMFTSTVEVEATLAPNVVMPDGVALADIEVRLEDSDNTYLLASLALVDDDPAHEAIFEFINPLHNPHEIHFESDLGLIIEAEPQLPYTFDVPSGEIDVLVFTITGVSLAHQTNLEVEASLGDGVSLPEIDGMLVEMAELRARLTDYDGNEMEGALGNLDDDEAFEAMFSDIDPDAGPYTIDFVSNLELSILTNPETPFTAEPPADETSTYSFTLTSVEGPEVLSNVEVEAILGANVQMPTVGGELVLMRDLSARLTDADGNETVIALADSDEDEYHEATFQGVDPDLGPYTIDFTNDLGLTLVTSPVTPQDVELEAGDSTYSYILTSVTAPVEVGTLVVKLRFDTDVNLQGLSAEETDCEMVDEDGAVVSSNFVEINGVWSVTFENLDVSKVWVIDLDTPSGVVVNTVPALPYDVQLAAGQTTTVEFLVDSVTIDL